MSAGGCLCGSVRFAAEPPLRDVVVCHCSLCRRSGTLAGAYTSVAQDALTINDQGGLAWYVDVNGRERGFCSRCGSTLFWRTRPGTAVSISAGALDDSGALKTEAHTFVSDAASWECVPEDAPRRVEGQASPRL